MGFAHTICIQFFEANLGSPLGLPWLVVDMECFDVTLPCKPCAHMQILASDVIDKADFYRGKFDSAKPFRHVLITPFFDSAIAEAMLKEFPVPLESQMRGEVGEKCRKFACHDVRSIGPTYRLVDDYVSSPSLPRLWSALPGSRICFMIPGITVAELTIIYRVKEC